MNADPNMAGLATLLVEPARAAILMHLLDGRSWTAAELAKVAGVKASTASAHLRKLTEGHLIRASSAGRHRYFRIADAEVAHRLEQLAFLAAPGSAETPGAKRAAANLRACRLCYDHIAGRLGVCLTLRMVELSWLIEDEPWYRLTALGERALSGLDVGRVEGRTCVDWSERRFHLAGPLGRQFAQACINRRWLQRDCRSRALSVTPLGIEMMGALFGTAVIEPVALHAPAERSVRF
ncbi:MAG TPA: winged helix-turn-helix domain-containing protein [Steroidobacteraceae bacterium]|jgi:DNA-binding transcriptional ArsR family regulator|nr:winged helix-turn-helix domain-containing protein [Steroidobacteraceae bacterium]